MVDFVTLQKIMADHLETDRMVQSVEAVGPTLEAAVSDAAALLNIPSHRLEYEIIEKGTSGFWGMGKKDWRIRAYEKISAAKKKRQQAIIDEEVRADIAVIEDKDGEAFVHFKSGGDVMLKVTPASGQGKKASEIYAMHFLQDRKADKVDAAQVRKIVNEASGEYIKVAEFEHRSYNDSVVYVEISEDEMTALVMTTPASEGGCDVSYETYITTLKHNRIVHGIKEEFLQHFVDQPIYNEKVVIAEGEKPIDGKNAYMQYNFETDLNKIRLKEGSDGKIDFKELNIIQNVVENQPLAVKIPPEKGTPGWTVTGKMLDAKDGVDISLPVGANVQVSEDGSTILADINGQVVMSNGLINIEPVYTVDGGVNLKSGNIEFLGTVMVNGDVEDGFFVKAAGNIEVNGSVGKSDLQAEGDIIIHQGINGKGEGRIHAGKSLWARFIQNSNIQSGDMVVASDGIINSNIVADNRIICQGKRASIMGGKLRAGEEINAKTLGNPTSGTETVCEVGYDPKSKEELERLQMEKDNANKLLDEMKPNILTLTNLKQQKRTLPDDKETMLQDLITKREMLTTDLKKIDEGIKKIQEYLNSLKARGRVSASQKIYPGVKIIIRDVREEVHAEHKAASFILEGGLIRATKYEEPDDRSKKGPDGYTTN
jgi:uncharacterized protein (DUF342 family)